uniref:Uncharacterized protein n=1 Tax=Rhizophora mucronata TaxID=61149 RepID=A0A2P2QPD1_RHIMU
MAFHRSMMHTKKAKGNRANPQILTERSSDFHFHVMDVVVRGISHRGF